jgi:uncharacterized protein DUF5658
MTRSMTVVLATLVGLAIGSPARAADKDGVLKTAAAVDSVAVAPLAADVDWSLPAIELGQAKRPGSLSMLYASFASLQIFDAVSTLHGVQRGGAEGNPVVSGLVGNPAALWALKGGVSAASIAVAERLWRQHRRGASIATMVAANGVMAAVAARNASVLRNLR